MLSIGVHDDDDVVVRDIDCELVVFTLGFGVDGDGDDKLVKVGLGGIDGDDDDSDSNHASSSDTAGLTMTIMLTVCS